MKTFTILIVFFVLTFAAVHALAGDPDLNGCWDVYIDQIDSDGVKGTEHNTIWVVQDANDNRFSGYVANLPSSELGRKFSGVVMGKEVFITHWDSLTKATLIGKDTLSGVNQSFDIDQRSSKTASAMATRLDTDGCCNGNWDVADGETDIDCGGPCGGCFTGSVCIDNADCLSDNCVGGTCE